MHGDVRTNDDKTEEGEHHRTKVVDTLTCAMGRLFVPEMGSSILLIARQGTLMFDATLTELILV